MLRAYTLNAVRFNKSCIGYRLNVLKRNPRSCMPNANCERFTNVNTISLISSNVFRRLCWTHFFPINDFLSTHHFLSAINIGWAWNKTEIKNLQCGKWVDGWTVGENNNVQPQKSHSNFNDISFPRVFFGTGKFIFISHVKRLQHRFKR